MERTTPLAIGTYWAGDWVPVKKAALGQGASLRLAPRCRRPRPQSALTAASPTGRQVLRRTWPITMSRGTGTTRARTRPTPTTRLLAARRRRAHAGDGHADRPGGGISVQRQPRALGYDEGGACRHRPCDDPGLHRVDRGSGGGLQPERARRRVRARLTRCGTHSRSGGPTATAGSRTASSRRSAGRPRATTRPGSTCRRAGSTTTATQPGTPSPAGRTRPGRSSTQLVGQRAEDQAGRPARRTARLAVPRRTRSATRATSATTR